jgi:tRNA(adenine34) deaminase
MRQAAARLGNYRLAGATLYVTIEPCVMCVGAIVHARVSRLIYGAEDPKSGAVTSLYRMLEDRRLNHRVEVKKGVLAGLCAELLSRFFREKRIKND